MQDLMADPFAQDALRKQIQTRAKHKTILNRISTLLQSYSSSSPEFQIALATAVSVFLGCGGRLCMKKNVPTLRHRPLKDFTDCLAASSREVKVYTFGSQPIIPARAQIKLIEQYPLWQEHDYSGPDQVWAIANLYQTPELQPLFEAFRPTPIRSLFMIPLIYHQRLVGYLSIFRNSTMPPFPPIHQAVTPRCDQAQRWASLKLAQQLGRTFATSVYKHEVSQAHPSSNPRFTTDLQQHVAQLIQFAQPEKTRLKC